MNDTFFYGIDFKKIKLYCKIVDYISLREKYTEWKLDVNLDKFHEVVGIDFYDQFVKIRLYDKKFGNYVYVELDFDWIEFAYFFENTKEEELNSLEL